MESFSVVDILQELKRMQSHGDISAWDMKKLWKKTLTEGPSEEIIQQVFSWGQGEEAQSEEDLSFHEETLEENNSKMETQQGFSKCKIGDDFLEIADIGFWGECTTSKSGEWAIGWSDFSIDETGFRMGHRENGEGRVILYNLFEDKLVVDKNLGRPNSGKVADNGFFSIEDWGLGNRLASFYVISPTGEIIIRKKLHSNIYNSAISPAGYFAICQTCNGERDGNKLMAFDIIKGLELFSVDSKTIWADRYEFNERTPSFSVVFPDLGKFRYDVEGNFVDVEKYDTARLESKQYWIILETAAEILKNPNLDRKRGQQVLEAVLRARSSISNNDQRRKAQALKLQGLAHDFLGNSDDALEAFEEALIIDPKIGVKRKATALRKKLNKS